MPECMAEGIIGEIFSSIQGEGPLIGRRQIFVRMAGCNLDCIYCDTGAFKARSEECKIEHTASSGMLERVQNPMSIGNVMERILMLRSPSLHSISITGGEPLCQAAFVKDLAGECRRSGLMVYLETNGYSRERFSDLAGLIDYAAIDLKLQSHGSCPVCQHQALIDNEIECVRISSASGVSTIVKIVILDGTEKAELEQACSRLEGLDAVVVLQPASGRFAPANDKILQLQDLASDYLGPGNVAVIPQVHKLIGVP